jgi:hypothetical protein
MRTQRTSKFLLSSFAGILLSGLIGFAAGESPIVDAAKRDDGATVRALIAKRVDVNEPSRDGSTALLWAAYHSDVAMTRALLAAGAKPNVPNKYGITPLLQASRTGADPIVQALLRAGADPRARHPEGETALMAAAFAGSLNSVRLLIEANADRQRGGRLSEADGVDARGLRRAFRRHSSAARRESDPNRRAHVTQLEERKHADSRDRRLHGADVRGTQRPRGRHPYPDQGRSRFRS